MDVPVSSCCPSQSLRCWTPMAKPPLKGYALSFSPIFMPFIGPFPMRITDFHLRELYTLKARDSPRRRLLHLSPYLLRLLARSFSVEGSTFRAVLPRAQLERLLRFCSPSYLQTPRETVASPHTELISNWGRPPFSVSSKPWYHAPTLQEGFQDAVPPPPLHLDPMSAPLPFFNEKGQAPFKGSTTVFLAQFFRIQLPHHPSVPIARMHFFAFEVVCYGEALLSFIILRFLSILSAPICVFFFRSPGIAFLLLVTYQRRSPFAPQTLPSWKPSAFPPNYFFGG